jgi:hypothetical protein
MADDFCEKEGVMERNRKALIGAVLCGLFGAAVSLAQDPSLVPKRGNQIRVEGEIVYLQTTGPALLELKTVEGRKYRVQLPLGSLAEAGRTRLNLKVGERIAVAGEVVCVLGETTVIAGSGITVKRNAPYAKGPS